MVGSKGGPGDVNRTHPCSCGQQTLLGVEVLKNCLDELQNWENIAPNKMAPNARKRLGHVCQDMAAGLSGVDQCTGMLYAAEKIVRENMTPGRTLDGSCNLLSALEACDKCDDSRCVFYYCRTYYKAVRVGGAGRGCRGTSPERVECHCGSGGSSSSPIQGWRCPNSYASKRALV